jgi:hypothetical protein
MKYAKITVNRQFIDKATLTAIREGDKLIQLAEDFQKDSEKTKRLDQQTCKRCFYLRRGTLVMQAITEQSCGICDEEQHYSNSHTDVICKVCAKENDLCAHCGSDINLTQLKKKSKK